MMKFKTIKDVGVRNKRVLVRCDFNVPLKDGRILDDSRLRAHLPTLEYLINHQAKVILISHLGRPHGQRLASLSLDPIVRYLRKLLNLPIFKCNDCFSQETKKILEKLQPGKVAILENIRFYPGEEKGDLKLAKELASLADLFVNDAFSVSHRRHASTYYIGRYLPSVAGLALEKEVEILSSLLERPALPFVLVVGGAKVEDKIRVIEGLLKKVDFVLVGGGIANTFLRAQNQAIGQSLYDLTFLKEAQKLLKKGKIILPLDGVVAQGLPQTAQKIRRVDYLKDQVKPQESIFDLGPQTLSYYEKFLRQAKTIVWVGPVGVFEEKAFSQGTKQLGKVIGEMGQTSTLAVAGGGDTLEAIKKFHLKGFDHLSLGGGAMLEFLSKKTLAGLQILERSK